MKTAIIAQTKNMYVELQLNYKLASELLLAMGVSPVIAEEPLSINIPEFLVNHFIKDKDLGELKSIFENCGALKLDVHFGSYDEKSRRGGKLLTNIFEVETENCRLYCLSDKVIPEPVKLKMSAFINGIDGNSVKEALGGMEGTFDTAAAEEEKGFMGTGPIGNEDGTPFSSSPMMSAMIASGYEEWKPETKEEAVA